MVRECAGFKAPNQKRHDVWRSSRAAQLNGARWRGET
jgi:hypothetical protein